jgi:hypothetical protein
MFHVNGASWQEIAACIEGIDPEQWLWNSAQTRRRITCEQDLKGENRPSSWIRLSVGYAYVVGIEDG